MIAFFLAIVFALFAKRGSRLLWFFVWWLLFAVFDLHWLILLPIIAIPAVLTG